MKAAPVLLLILVAAILAGGLFWSGYLDPAGEDSGPGTTAAAPAPVPLLAHGAITKTHVAVKNLNPFAWTDVELVVSPTADGRGVWYAYKLEGAVGAGQIAGGMLRQFVNDRGERFDPDALRARRIRISATTPNGRGTWSGAKEWPTPSTDREGQKQGKGDL